MKSTADAADADDSAARRATPTLVEAAAISQVTFWVNATRHQRVSERIV